jgi:hypothetical protein
VARIRERCCAGAEPNQAPQTNRTAPGRRAVPTDISHFPARVVDSPAGASKIVHGTLRDAAERPMTVHMKAHLSWQQRLRSSWLCETGTVTNSMAG